MNKGNLRKEIQQMLTGLSDSYKKESSKAISAFLLNSEFFSEAQSLFIYMGTENEPDTSTLIHKALQEGKTVYVPKCIKKGVMVPVEITDDTVFVSGYMGIREPVSFDDSIRLSEIDLSVIPCVSVSLTGDRLGHGAGFYDIFLKNTVTKKVCLCFDELISENIPTEKNDVSMDVVITEKGIFIREEKK